MKIAIIGVYTIAYSTSIFLANAFEKLGHEVFRYDYRDKAREFQMIFFIPKTL